jgi:hypothetical protein
MRVSLLLLLFVVPVSAQTANTGWRYYRGDEGIRNREAERHNDLSAVRDQPNWILRQI